MLNNNNKKLAKNSLILYIRMFVTMIVSLFTSRIILDSLGIIDYGIYNAVGGIVILFSFINLAMTNSTTRYVTFSIGKNNIKEVNKIFSSSIIIHFFLGIIILLLCESVGLWFFNNKMQIPSDRINAAYYVFHFSVISAFISIITVPYTSVIIANEKMGIYAYLTIFEVIMKLIVSYIITIFKYDKLIIYSLLLLFIQASISCYYIINVKRFLITKDFTIIFDKKNIKEMSGFAMWCLFGNFSYISYTQGINLLLNVFFGPSVNAARGIAIQIQGAVSKFISGFQTAINPQITKRYAEGQIEELHKLIFISSKYSFYLILILSLPLIFKIDYILSIWLNEIPNNTNHFSILMILTASLTTLANPLNVAAQATGKIKKYQLIEGFSLFLILPISYIFFYIGCGPISTYIINFIICLFVQIIRVMLLSKMIKLSIKEYFNEVVIKLLVSISLSSISIYFIARLFSNLSIFKLLLFITISISVISIIIFIFGLNSNEKKYIINLVRNRIKI